MNKGGLVFKKQEMSKLWWEDNFVPVTLLKLPNQKILRYKTEDKDGYNAVVVGVEEKEVKGKEKGEKTKYSMITEFKVDKDFMDSYEVGSELPVSLLDDAEVVKVVGNSKGKGFQGVMKRHNFAGGRKTHGSHFHRSPGSIGSMKPNRVHKGRLMAGHMGNEKVTLKNVKLMDKFDFDGETVVAIKGSVPGAYNSLLKVEL